MAACIEWVPSDDDEDVSNYTKKLLEFEWDYNYNYLTHLAAKSCNSAFNILESKGIEDCLKDLYGLCDVTQFKLIDNKNHIIYEMIQTYPLETYMKRNYGHNITYLPSVLRKRSLTDCNIYDKKKFVIEEKSSTISVRNIHHGSYHTYHTQSGRRMIDPSQELKRSVIENMINDIFNIIGMFWINRFGTDITDIFSKLFILINEQHTLESLEECTFLQVLEKSLLKTLCFNQLCHKLYGEISDHISNAPLIEQERMKLKLLRDILVCHYLDENNEISMKRCTKIIHAIKTSLMECQSTYTNTLM